jgi:hypothetical protein
VQPEPRRPSYEELAELVALQAGTIERLTARVEQLEAENVELRRRLEANSSNSSRPPSQDGLGKRKRSSGSSGGKRGKPFGAPGVTKRLVDDSHATIECRPAVCGRCDTGLADSVEFSRQRRQVIELPPPPKATVTEYQVISLVCPCCGAVTAAAAPAGVTGRVQYGPGVKARLALCMPKMPSALLSAQVGVVGHGDQPGEQRIRFQPADRALLAALLHPLPREDAPKRGLSCVNHRSAPSTAGKQTQSARTGRPDPPKLTRSRGEVFSVARATRRIWPPRTVNRIVACAVAGPQRAAVGPAGPE